MLGVSALVAAGNIGVITIGVDTYILYINVYIYIYIYTCLLLVEL